MGADSRARVAFDSAAVQWGLVANDAFVARSNLRRAMAVARAPDQLRDFGPFQLAAWQNAASAVRVMDRMAQ
eukprot:603596-Alexandrium_andersonii.AAC.1